MSSIRLQIKDSIMHYLCDDWNNHKRGKAHKENQAIFDRKDGYACWCNTDLEMVMEKVVKGIYATDFDTYEKQIRADAIDEFADNMQLVKLAECDDVPRELVEAIEKQIGICALRVKEKILKEQKNERGIDG